MRKLAVLFALLGSLFVVSAAQAAPPTSVFDGTIACTTQGPGPAEGQTWCGTGQHNQNANVRSTVESFVVRMIVPNMETMARGVQGYLDDQSQQG